MRIAYLVGNSAADTDTASARQDFVELLADAHLRFTTRVLEPEDGILEGLDRALRRRQQPGHALFVFTGDARIEKDDLALSVLDYDTSLRGLGESLAHSQMAFALVLDLHHEGPDDPFLAAEIVAAAKTALQDIDITLLVGVSARESERALPDAPLLHCLTRAISESKEAVETRTLATASIYERMRKVDGFDDLSAVGFAAAERPFPLLVPPNVIVNDLASIPPPPSSGEAMPESLRSGDANYEAGNYAEAIADYKKRLLKLGARDPARADVYFRIGRCKRSLGSAAEAAHNFDKALELDPMHSDALDGACDVLAEQRDFERLEAMRRRRLDALTDESERTAQLEAIARAWLVAGQPKKSLTALEQWAKETTGRAPLELMVEAHDSIGRASDRVAARRRLAERLEGRARADVLVQAARIAEAELSGGKEVVELCREALQAHAETLEALELAAKVLGTSRRYDELTGLYELVLLGTQDDELRWDLSKKLGLLHRDVRDDLQQALRCFLRAADFKADDVELLLWISELYQAEQKHDEAASVLRRAAQCRPDDADVVRRALWAFEKVRDDDSAWNAECILDHLGEADINESLNADAHRPDGLIAARTTLGAVEASLFAPERDAQLSAILRVCAAAALPLAFEELEREGALVDHARGARQAEGSTTTIARSLAWTCKLLAIPAPPLYVVEGLPQGAVVLARETHVAIADRSLGSGLELAELAFLWARALAGAQGENAFLAACPSPQRLAKVVVAALLLAKAPGLEDLDGPPRLFADLLGPRLSHEDLDRLAEVSQGVQTRGARARLSEWLESTALLGGRMGLLLCGDVRRAVDVATRFPLPDILLELQVKDLYRRALSEEHIQLRRTLGINVHA
ncbi:MAG: hypothetical protein R3B13_40800 [Polyangiaceae bacterium]